MQDIYRAHRGRLLAEHVKAYVADLRALGRLLAVVDEEYELVYRMILATGLRRG